MAAFTGYERLSIMIMITPISIPWALAVWPQSDVRTASRLGEAFRTAVCSSIAAAVMDRGTLPVVSLSNTSASSSAGFRK